MGYKALFETIRSLGFGSISGTYAKVGSVLANPVRIICFSNSTTSDVFISDDGTNNKLYIPANGFKLFDVTTNRLQTDLGLSVAVNTQFWVKTVSGAAATGAAGSAVYIEIVYGG